MRYKAYKDANRVDPRTGKVPTKKVQLSCHKGRWVNPRDRAIFPTGGPGERSPCNIRQNKARQIEFS